MKIEEYCLFNLVKDFFENNKKKGNENFFKNNEEKYHNIDKNLVLSECKLKNIICSTWLKTSSKNSKEKSVEDFFEYNDEKEHNIDKGDELNSKKKRKLLNLLTKNQARNKRKRKML